MLFMGVGGFKSQLLPVLDKLTKDESPVVRKPIASGIHEVII